MVENGYGRIVSSSLAGVEENFGQVNHSASKSGIMAMTKTMAREGAAKGITANCVAPGFVETPMTAAITEDVKQGMINSIPVKRIGLPMLICS